MTTNNITNLSDAKFQEIYSDERLRNAVAYAHGCYDSNSNFKYYKALYYPESFIVTPEQIELANAEILRAKAEKVTNLQKRCLVFVGMGMSYEARYDGDLCNYRIRTEFKNKNGKRFFIEVGTGKGNNMHCDHAIDLDLKDYHESKLNEISERSKGVKKYSTEWHLLMTEREKYMKQPYNNYNGVEHMTFGIYSKRCLIELINEMFDCNYTDIVVDNYTLRTDDFTCFC